MKQSLNLFLNNLKKLVSLDGDVSTLKQPKEGTHRFRALFEDGETMHRTDGFRGRGKDIIMMSEEELQAYTAQKEVKELKEEVINSVNSFINSNNITEELYSTLGTILSGDINANTISDIRQLLSTENKDGVKTDKTAEEKTPTTLTSQNDIEKYLKSDKVSIKAKESILKQIGGAEEITSIEISKSGIAKLNTKEAGSVTMFSSGNYILSYDDAAKTGFDTYDEEGRVTNSLYVDHSRMDIAVQENTVYNKDNSSTKTVQKSNEPFSKQTVQISPENDILSVSTENTQTGEVTVNYSKESKCPQVDSSSSLDSLTADLGASNSELESLIQEQTEVQTDLSEQQNTYSATQSEAETTLSGIDSEIQSGNCELEGSKSNLADAESGLCDAQGELECAKQTLDTTQTDCTEKQDTLTEAQGETETAQAEEVQAADENERAIAEEDEAKTEKDVADTDLGIAKDETKAATDTQKGTQADLTAAIGETKVAFNARNQEQVKVDAAQREYNSAQASKQSLWDKMKDAVSSLLNRLRNALNAAIQGRDRAQRELETKQNEEEKSKIINDKAIEELDKKHEAQDKAQEIADKTQDILDIKTGEREATDQEYADALLDLADAMMAQNDAQGKYDSALTAFMEAQGYHADAQGNVVDAQGNVVDCQQICSELEGFIQNLNAERTDTEASYNQVLDTTMGVIQGDEEKIASLGEQIETLRQQIAEQEAELALQEEMLAELAAERGEIDAAKDGAGIVDDVKSLFGFGNAADEKAYAQKRDLLEKAILSDDPATTQTAFKALHSEDEVYKLDGRIVDASQLSENELKQCVVVNVKDLSKDDLAQYYEKHKANAQVAAQYAKALTQGNLTYYGQSVNMEDVNAALKAQTKAMAEELEDAIAHQGIMGKGMDKINDLFGFGTSNSEARSQVEHYKAMIKKLENCKDPVQYAALYRSITGNNLDLTQVVQSLSYNEITTGKPTTATGARESKVPAANQYDLANDVNNMSQMVFDHANGNPAVLASGHSSRASEAIQDYIITQDNMVNTAKGVATGIITAAAVAAAPFTGGASIALGAAVGAGTNMLLGAADSVYDADDNGTLDFNYTAKEALQDGALGALSGMTSTGANQAGKALTSYLSKGASNAATTTFNEALKRNLVLGSARLTGAAFEGAIDGGFGSGGGYIINSLAEGEDISLDRLKDVTLQGMGMGAVLNVGIEGAKMTGSAIADGLHSNRQQSGLIVTDNPDAANYVSNKYDRPNNGNGTAGHTTADAGDTTGAQGAKSSAGTDNANKTSGFDDAASSKKTEQTGNKSGAAGANTNNTFNQNDWLNTKYTAQQASARAREIADEILSSDNPKKAFRKWAANLHPDNTGASAAGIDNSFGSEVFKYLNNFMDEARNS